MPAPIDWIIFTLGIAASVVIYYQRKAIKRHQNVDSFGVALLLLAYLEAQARAAKDVAYEKER